MLLFIKAFYLNRISIIREAKSRFQRDRVPYFIVNLNSFINNMMPTTNKGLTLGWHLHVI